MGEDGAYCFYTLSNDFRELDKAEWDKERFGQVCTKAETLAEWKANLLKLCKKTGLCTYETKKMISDFVTKMNYALSKNPRRNF